MYVAMLVSTQLREDSNRVADTQPRCQIGKLLCDSVMGKWRNVLGR